MSIASCPRWMRPLAVIALACCPLAGFAAPEPPADIPATSREYILDWQAYNGGQVMTEDHIGMCLLWSDRSIMFDRNTTDEALWNHIRTLPALPENHESYQIGGRWTSTATNSSIPIRRPFTLTYSFVPDGLSMEGGNSTLDATLSSHFGSTENWKNRFRTYFSDWGALDGITYVEVSDDGAAWGSPGSNTVGSTRGDCRIGMVPIDGPSNVLAFNYFPSNGIGGDMCMDSGDTSLWFSSSGQYRGLRNTVMHEHGHGIGLEHVDPINLTKLMEAFLATNFVGPQQDDIRGAQRNYGDNFEYNDIIANATDLGGTTSTAPADASFTNLSIENVANIDLYKFTVPSGMAITVTATPVGTTYAQGPQGGSTSNVNALSIHNLQIDILGLNGTTVLVSQNTAAIGLAETLTAFDLSDGSDGSGTYYLRIRASNTTPDDVQRYNLAVAFVTGSNAPDLVLDAAAIVSEGPLGNGNGGVDPGEQDAALSITLRNSGPGVANNPTGVASTTATGVILSNTNLVFPTLTTGQSGEATTPLLVSVDSDLPCGTIIPIHIEIQAGTSSFDIDYDLVLGVQVDGTIVDTPDNLPLAIPTNTTVTSTFVLAPGSGDVRDIDVRNIAITHPATGDLVLSLTSPSNTTITLFNRHGGGGDNIIGLNFDDDAPITISGGSAPFTNTFRPVQALSAFNGEPASGTWTLTIQDADANDSGTLTNVELDVDASLRECDAVSTGEPVAGIVAR